MGKKNNSKGNWEGSCNLTIVSKICYWNKFFILFINCVTFKFFRLISLKNNHVRIFKCNKIVYLKKTSILLKKWPLNLWWSLNKSIREVVNITKAATFKSFLHLSYKNTQIHLLWECFLIFFTRQTLNILAVTQKYELGVSFIPSQNE